MDVLPSRHEMESAVIELFGNTNEWIHTSEMNKAVANHMQIPRELLCITSSSGGTEFDCRMCWVRTNLKNKNVVESPKRGYWQFKPVKECEI